MMKPSVLVSFAAPRHRSWRKPERQRALPSMLLWSVLASLLLPSGLALAEETTPTAAPFVPVAPLPPPSESARHWRKTAKSKLKQLKRAATPGTRARNVILFVGDGMGISTVTAARILAGQRAGRSGEENLLSFEEFPYTALSKTYNTDGQTPDSAGTMTAMVTGVKTRVGVISVDQSIARGDCAGTAKASVKTLLEEAEDAGLATGIVSTARITHATPAATYAHAPDRNWEADGSLPPQAVAQGCTDIARQLIDFDHGDGIEVVLGGGRGMFLPKEQADFGGAGKFGQRADGANLVEQWQQRYPNGAWVWNNAQLDKLNPKRTERVLGLFSRSYMSFEHDRPKTDEPSLADMTEFAVKRLRRERQGFFLMVEAGRIDHGHHAGNAQRALSDTIELAEAVAVARKLVDTDDTLIIVTADHSHTLTISGYQARGTDILGLVRGPNGLPIPDAKNQPYTTLGYANGPGYTGASERQPEGPKRFPHYHTEKSDGITAGRPDLSQTEATDPNYLQEATVPLASETHGGEDVPIYAEGPGSQWVRGVLEQHMIYWIMREALDETLAGR